MSVEISMPANRIAAFDTFKSLRSLYYRLALTTSKHWVLVSSDLMPLQ